MNRYGLTALTDEECAELKAKGYSIADIIRIDMYTADVQTLEAYAEFGTLAEALNVAKLRVERARKYD